MLRLTGDPGERDFLNQVIQESGQDLRECLQCGKCTAGCPIASEKVGGPRQLIASLLMGWKERALQDPTWLYCVSCGTCAARCPVEINMYAVASTLAEMAEREKILPSEKDIPLFEKLFLQSVLRHGRVQELRTLVEFNLRSRKPFKDAALGLTLWRKQAISPFDLFGRGKNNRLAKRLFTRVQELKQGKKEA